MGTGGDHLLEARSFGAKKALSPNLLKNSQNDAIGRRGEVSLVKGESESESESVLGLRF